MSGRILAVLDVGLEVDGPSFNENGELVRRGEVIASLDNTRYRLRVGAVEAQLDAARKSLESVIAEWKLAGNTLERQQRVLIGGAGSPQAVDDAQGDYDRLTALRAQRAAEIRGIEDEVEGAHEDLIDTNLEAPFYGRITRIHVSQGAVVEPGAPVVTLSLMDPIQVQVAVSADMDRRVHKGDRVMLYPRDPLDPDGEPVQVNAIVYEKGAVADRDTRTFRIDLIARNERRHLADLNPETRDLPIVTDFYPAVRRYQGEMGPLYVPVDCILRENGETFVLRLPGVSFHPGARRSAVGKHIPEKIPVSLADEYYTVIKWNFRSLRGESDLREGDFLVVDPRPAHLAGLVISPPQWLFRRGDLVPVRFFLNATPKGTYVPVDAITIIDNNPTVYIVENEKAREVVVSVHETYHELRRVAAPELKPGSYVVVSGVHYISDGENVAVVGHERLAP